jgi:hypothetical protein
MASSPQQEEVGDSREDSHVLMHQALETCWTINSQSYDPTTGDLSSENSFGVHGLFVFAE